MRPRSMVVLGFVGAFCLFPAQPGRAQFSGGAIVLQVDPLTRASGMGHASGAVFWGLDCDHWANPALLGYERGIRFEHGLTRIEPDLIDDALFFTTDRITIGARGVGVFLSGFPVSCVGKTQFDYGESMAVDENGIELGTFHSWERTSSVGIGVSLSALMLRRSPSGSDLVARLARAGDLAFGLTCNRVRVRLAPDWAVPNEPPGAGTGKGTGLDGGVLLRLTPYNSIDSLGWFRPVDERLDLILGGFCFDASVGSSYQNFINSKIEYSGESSDPIPREHRLSGAARLSMGLPGIGRDWLGERGTGLVARSVTPLIQFGAAWDRTKRTGFDDPAPVYHRGWELTVANIYSIRRGHIDSRGRDDRGDTRGWGLGFRLGEYAAFRYDEDTTPRNRMAERYAMYEASRRGWTARIEPLAIWRDLGR